MSDPASEPGAPADGAAKQPLPPTDKGVARPKAPQHSSAVSRLIAQPNRIILRINKLISTPGGLSSFLSTFNYTLYLLAYAQTKEHTIRSKLHALLGSIVSPPPTTPVAVPVTPPRLAVLAALISSARTTFRLVGLFPIYGWMRQLMQGPKPGQDGVLYSTAVTQCTFYGIFQLLENIAVLTDAGVLNKSATARWNPSGDTARIKLWSYRAWFAGVLCDLVRLGREAQLERARRANRSDVESRSQKVREEDLTSDVKWWLEMLVPVGWTPLALHCSLEGGLPGFNLLIMGLSGFVAGMPRTAALWRQTAA